MSNSYNLIGKFKTVKEGYRYILAPFEGDLRKDEQKIQFIEKVPKEEGSTELITIHDGTTNEAVLEMMIDRLKFQNNKLPNRETSIAITKIEEALMWLEKRINDRKNRGVYNTMHK